MTNINEGKDVPTLSSQHALQTETHCSYSTSQSTMIMMFQGFRRSVTMSWIVLFHGSISQRTTFYHITESIL